MYIRIIEYMYACSTAHAPLGQLPGVERLDARHDGQVDDDADVGEEEEGRP
jgi:hypothetical protein